MSPVGKKFLCVIGSASDGVKLLGRLVSTVTILFHIVHPSGCALVVVQSAGAVYCTANETLWLYVNTYKTQAHTEYFLPELHANAS